VYKKKSHQIDGVAQETHNLRWTKSEGNPFSRGNEVQLEKARRRHIYEKVLVLACVAKNRGGGVGNKMIDEKCMEWGCRK